MPKMSSQTRHARAFAPAALNSSTSVRAQATQVFTNLLFAVRGHRPIA